MTTSDEKRIQILETQLKKTIGHYEILLDQNGIDYKIMPEIIEARKILNNE